MRYDYSARLRDDVNSAVQMAFKTAGIVNITAVAEQVRIRNLVENVALEDIEHLVLQAAQLIGAAIEFDGVTRIGAFTVDGLAKVGRLAGRFADGLVDEDGERAIVPLDLSHRTVVQ